MSTDRELLELAAKAAGMVYYNAYTGIMTWRRKPPEVKDSLRWNSRYGGVECGTIDDKGYRRILFRFDGGKPFRIRTHQLAWFIVMGNLVAGEVDHIDQDKLNNRIDNLRDVPKGINQRNSKLNSNNTSGISGVVWHKQTKRWCSQSTVNGKRHHIGLFDDIKVAALAVKKFQLTNEFTENHGRAA